MTYFVKVGRKTSFGFVIRSSPRRWPSRLELRCVRPYVHTATKSFSDFHVIWCVGRPWPHMHISVTSTQSKVKVKVTELPKLRKVHFSRSISSAVLCGAQKWWLAVIVRDLDYSLSESDFWISFRESYHESSNFALCPYFTIFQWPYFGSVWRYSHMVGRATSSTRTVYIDMTLTRSKVKVKVTEHLNVPQLPITAHF